MSNLVSLKVNCPKCKKSLMDHVQYLNAKPSIKVCIEITGNQGYINLCSVYGCFDHISNIDVPKGEIAKLSCPHCKKMLKGTDTCENCQAPMVDFSLEKGGKVSICTRSGCKKHYLAFEDISDALSALSKQYGYSPNEMY